MITYAKYNAIKILLAGGASIEEVCTTLLVTKETVYLVQKVQSYNDYKSECSSIKFLGRKKKEQEKARKADAEKTEHPAQIVEHRQSVTVQTTHFVETKIDKMIEMLTLLNNKLGFIVDELAGVKK